MKNKGYLLLLLFLSIGVFRSKAQGHDEKPIEKVVDEALEFSLAQSLLMAKKLEDEKEKLPKTFEDGELITSKSSWWCSGFFPGVLWYLYEGTGNKEVLNYAEDYTGRVENEKYTTDNHDVGFILYCSFGNGLRLKGTDYYEEVLMTGAKSLSTRYDSKMGLIRSWDFNRKKWQYPVIIDNMMNLELLLWASSYSGNDDFKEIAMSHADKTMKHHYRKDYSCYHVVSYDTLSSKPHIKQTFQGYNDASSWSRGQAWGLYGYTMMYRETGKNRYLKQAEKIASYMLNHPNMPDDYIPYWDFDDPSIPGTERDASAGALIASAMIELSQYVGEKKSQLYLDIAKKQIRALSSSEYRAELGKNGGFILQHSVGSKPHDSEVDVPLTYADYYYLEALIRLKRILT